MKVKHVLLILLLGVLLIGTAALFKLESWEGASEVLLGGYALLVIGLVLSAYKLYQLPGVKNILNQ